MWGDAKELQGAFHADSDEQDHEDIKRAYGTLGLTMLSTFRMLFYDLNPDLFFHHRFPMLVFAVFILFSFLAIIVMLNLLIAIMDGSYENISENAEPMSLKEKAMLILDVIAVMPTEEKTLERFPCWLHMLKPKGQGDSMDAASSAFDSTGVRSITRTLQAHSTLQMAAFEARMVAKAERQEHKIESGKPALWAVPLHLKPSYYAKSSECGCCLLSGWLGVIPRRDCCDHAEAVGVDA